MSALGQKQTLGKVRLMSALPPKADIDRERRHRHASAADCASMVKMQKMPVVGSAALAVGPCHAGK